MVSKLAFELIDGALASQEASKVLLESFETIDDNASNSSSTLPSHCSASQSSTSQLFFSSSAPLSSEALQLVISECKLKAKIVDLCEKGDSYIRELASDETVLEEGDILKM
ncbi:hypothetical protein ACE6H2_002431 [Prunus campanulata]